jgi:hypothetical protein
VDHRAIVAVEDVHDAEAGQDTCIERLSTRRWIERSAIQGNE